MRKLKGFTLIELLIVVAIIAILAAIAIPNFLEAQIRSKVARVKADHRSMAVGLETYYVDNNVYPAWAATVSNGLPNATGPFSGGPNLTINVNWAILDPVSPAAADIQGVRTFALAPDTLYPMYSLTTPIAYLSNYPADPFASTRGAVFAYYTDLLNQGWVLWSFGPDLDEGTNGGNLNVPIETIYTPGTAAQPSLTLIAGSSPGAFNYDPTNGSNSPGDIFRVK